MGAVLCGWWESKCVPGSASWHMCSSGLCMSETDCAQVCVYACKCELVGEGCACDSGCSIQVYWGMGKGRLRQRLGEKYPSITT